jgi:hypothetical protein
MAKKTSKRKSRVPATVSSPVFLPDHLDMVRAIAMTGMSDDEMAVALGISPDHLQSWKAYYPSLQRAIDEGRTAADARVVAALFENAIGFEYPEDVIDKEGNLHTVNKRKLPDTVAQKFWLENRSPHWRHSRNTQIAVGGHPNLPAIGIESKTDVINSILNLIVPKPDKT